MHDQEASMQAEAEALRGAYAALNRNDISGFIALFDPEIERIEPTEVRHAGTYRGLESVKAHFLKARGTWAEGSCEPKRFIVAPHSPDGDRLVVCVHVRVRLKAETEWREGRVGDVFTFRNGRVIQFQTFVSEEQAFASVGIPPSEAARRPG